MRLSGNIAADGEKAVALRDARNLDKLLRDFFSWQPLIPTDRKGKVNLAAFAGLLAPLCRMLRDDVTEALRNPDSPLVQLAADWRQLLFPHASDEQFADAYAQTVTFALLLGRSEGANPLSLSSAQATLASEHSLLSRALQVLTDPVAHVEMAASLDLLLRIVAVVPPASLRGPEDPWLYFYEDFLAAYDPELRKDAGAYYTPVEVVRAQVRLVDDFIQNTLGKARGFADPDIVTLDPAVGTGTYLLGVIEQALSKVHQREGKGAVAGQASALSKNLYGFELMVGPYAVAELRVSRTFRDLGATLPSDGSHIYLTDTLESPDAEPPVIPLFLKPIAEQHAKALSVKSNVPVIVCIGNPPYDRHEAAAIGNKARTGGWVRWGEDETDVPILRDFIEPAIAAGHGGDIKNLYNLYVYFWRWALWKVFEHETAQGPGIVSFISAASYLEGSAFGGMREHMRRVCDDIWVIDLGGESRGTRKSENVFAIQTPVAIAIAARSKKRRIVLPAKVHYARIEGTREEKLAALDKLTALDEILWEDCPSDWQAPFRPAGKGTYFEWPLVIDLMPWQHSGIECKRTWPIAPDGETLERRWRALMQSRDRAALFRETGDRKVEGKYSVSLTPNSSPEPIAKLPQNSPIPPVVEVGFRSLDRQKIIADGRLMSRPRADLWRAHGPKQIYVTSLFNHPLGTGPAATACSSIPDRHHFRGSYGGKDVIPLYRTMDQSEPNIVPGLLKMLTVDYKRAVSPEDLVAYLYGLIAQPAFTQRFTKELETRELRVPFTRDPVLFVNVTDLGAHLLWLHTYGTRFVPKGKRVGHVPSGAAKCLDAVPGNLAQYPESFEYDAETKTLLVGRGKFRPVDPAVFDFNVSGFYVVQSWLSYRMKKGAGKKSSALDNVRPERWSSQFTTELLELLWVVEGTLNCYERQATLLERVISGKCYGSEDLPNVPEESRKAPGEPGANEELFG